MDWKSLGKILERSFKEHWERPALSNYGDDPVSYGELASRIKRLHNLFEDNGLRVGDRVALCSHNQANWAVCFLATLTYGAVPVLILHEFKPENIHNLVCHSEARIFFVEDSILEKLSADQMPGVSLLVRMDSLEDMFAGATAGFCPEDVRYHEDKPDELAMINYTSGTSGFSKGVMIPYRSVIFNLRFSREVAEPQMNSSSKVIAMLPSAHMYGMMFEFFYEIMIGAHVMFLTRVPSPRIIMSAFADVHPDLVVAVPLIVEKLYKSRLKEVADSTRFLRSIPLVGLAVKNKIRKELVGVFGGRFEEVIIGGAPFNSEVEAFLRDIRFPFTVGYGMTECGPIITYSKWKKTRKGSCGRAVPGCRIRIDSPDPAHIAGEIQVSGDNVFLGYYKNPEATADAFTSDGWFRTGDIGVMGKDGYLYLRGRSKCMILGPSGQNIYPEELEAVINNVSFVSESLVVEEDGALTALVYPDYALAEKEGLDRDALKEQLTLSLPLINKSLPSYSQIRRMELMQEDFERTPKHSIKRYLYQKDRI